MLDKLVRDALVILQSGMVRSGTRRITVVDDHYRHWPRRAGRYGGCTSVLDPH
jgi:hypothetical protein